MSVLLLSLLKRFWPYLAGVLLVGGVLYFAFDKGEAHVQAKWDAAKLAEQKEVAAIATKQQVVTTKTVTEYVDRIQVVHDKAAAVVRQVPVYITKHDDIACPIPNGFVSLWNAANSGMQLPNTPNGAYEAPSGVRLSDVATEHARESEYANAADAKVTALQDWIKAQSAVSSAK